MSTQQRSAESIPHSTEGIDQLRFPVSEFRHKLDPIPTRQRDLSCSDFIRVVAQGGKPFITTDKDRAPYVSGKFISAPFIGNTLKKKLAAGLTGDRLIGVQRSLSHCAGSMFLKHDLDDVSAEELFYARQAAADSGLAYVLFSTFKNGLVPGVYRARLVTFLDEMLPPDQYKLVSKYVGEALLGRSYDDTEHMAYQLAGAFVAHPDRKEAAFVRAKRRGAAISAKDAYRLAVAKYPPKVKETRFAQATPKTSDELTAKAWDAIPFVDTESYKDWMDALMAVAALRPKVGDIEADRMAEVLSNNASESSQGKNSDPSFDPLVVSHVPTLMGPENGLAILMCRASDRASTIIHKDLHRGVVSIRGRKACTYLARNHTATLVAIKKQYSSMEAAS